MIFKAGSVKTWRGQIIVTLQHSTAQRPLLSNVTRTSSSLTTKKLRIIAQAFSCPEYHEVNPKNQSTCAKFIGAQGPKIQRYRSLLFPPRHIPILPLFCFATSHRSHVPQPLPYRFSTNRLSLTGLSAALCPAKLGSGSFSASN